MQTIDLEATRNSNMNGRMATFLDSCRNKASALLEIMKSIALLSQEHKLSAPGTNFDTALKRLQAALANILFVGEIKRGKTSLVNALTGLSLPTEVDVATCQLYRISHGTEQKCFVRFIDDTSCEITLKEAYRLGAQQSVDSGEALTFDLPIKWIEIQTPFVLLPAESVIFDTPGTGGVHPEHARLVRGLLEDEADGVVFVLSSTKPIDHSEIQFLREILEKTKRVLFVQTMIDCVTEEEWSKVKSRNETILRGEFGDSGIDFTVWPISSTLLRKASLEDPNTSVRLVASRHQQFAPTFKRFVEEVVGISRFERANLMSQATVLQFQQDLTKRHETILSENESKINADRVNLARRRQMFEDQKSSFHTSTKERLYALQLQAEAWQHRIEDLFFDLERELSSEFAHLNTSSDLEQTAARFSLHVSVKVEDLLREFQSDLHQSHGNALIDLVNETEEALLANQMTPAPEIPLNPQYPRVEMDLLNRIFNGKNQASAATLLVGLPAGALAWIGILAPPIAIAAGTAAMIWGFISGWKFASRAETNAAKAKAIQHFERLLRKARVTCMRYASAIQRQYDKVLREQLDEYARQSGEKAKDEYEFLLQQSQKSASERKEESVSILAKLNVWHRIADQLKAVS